MLTLYNGDCLEVMRDISSNSVDLIICDLPYGCMTKGAKGIVGKKSKCYLTQTWDVKIDLPPFWKEVKRVCKDKMTPILMFCSLRFYGELYASNPKWYQYGLIWKKHRGTNYMEANIKPLNDFEVIAVFGKQRPYFDRKDGVCMKSVLEYPIPSKKIHPTEKPTDLYRFLIERYCPVGGTVLDPTFGSGNSVFTAFDMDRNAIGIEKDEGFYKKAVARLEQI